MSSTGDKFEGSRSRDRGGMCADRVVSYVSGPQGDRSAPFIRPGVASSHDEEASMFTVALMGCQECSHLFVYPLSYSPSLYIGNAVSSNARQYEQFVSSPCWERRGCVLCMVYQNIRAQWSSYPASEPSAAIIVERCRL